MDFQDFFPVWKDLTLSQQKKISDNIATPAPYLREQFCITEARTAPGFC